METSAKTGMNAQELFAEAAKLLYQDYTKYKEYNMMKWKDVILLSFYS